MSGRQHAGAGAGTDAGSAAPAGPEADTHGRAQAAASGPAPHVRSGSAKDGTGMGVTDGNMAGAAGAGVAGGCWAGAEARAVTGSGPGTGSGAAAGPGLPPGLPGTAEAQALDAALWRFMLTLYARPGVQAACLEIQSRNGADIVLLLTWFFCRHGHAGSRLLDSARIAGLQAHVAEWRARMVLPLRQLRTGLREGSSGLPDQARESLRARIKLLELQAERVQVAMIAEWLCAHPPAPGPPAPGPPAPGPETEAGPESEAGLALLTGAPERVRAPLDVLRRAAEAL